MTNEEIIAKIQVENDKITEAGCEIQLLYNALRDNSPIQIGDRVLITTPAHKELWSKRSIIPESTKEMECVELEINNWSDYVTVDPVYHPITKVGIVAKVGRWKASKTDIVKKIETSYI